MFPVSFTGALLLIVLAIVLQARLTPGPATRWIVAALLLYGVVLAITGAVLAAFARALLLHGRQHRHASELRAERRR